MIALLPLLPFLVYVGVLFVVLAPVQGPQPARTYLRRRTVLGWALVALSVLVVLVVMA